MKIYRCDKCGHEHTEKRGIVGNEFAYHGFVTLSGAYRFGSVVDVCSTCKNEILSAAEAVNKEQEKTWRTRFLSKLGITA